MDMDMEEAGLSSEFDVGINILQKEGIDKITHNLELGLPFDKLFTAEECMRFYTIVYDAVSVPSDHGGGVVSSMYCLYQKAFEDYISSKVLPCLRCYENDDLLRELVRRWRNHKIMTKWLSGFFRFLPTQNYSSRVEALPSFVQINHLEFCAQACLEIMDQVSRAITSLVDRHREGEEIDLGIVKQVMDIFDEIGGVALNKFELNKIGIYFKSLLRLFSHGTKYSDSYLSYPVGKLNARIGYLFRDEKAKASHFLSLINKDKILEVYGEIKGRIHDAMAPHLEKQRLGEGEIVDDGAMFNDISAILDESSRFYAKDIEEALLEATARFYSKKALHWMATKSYEDYMRKVEECLQNEERRVSDFLRPTKKRELLEVVQHELVDVKHTS